MSDGRDLEAFIDAGVVLLGLPIDPAWRAAIRQHLATTLGAAQAVGGFPLPDDLDPAPVFEA